jgi:tetratricopeptide (TPR) repeat protein
MQGDLDEARRQIEASLTLAQQISGGMVIPLCQHALGEVTRLQGDNEEAEVLLRKSLAQFQEMGLTSQLPLCLNSLGHLAYARGAYEQAEQLLQESVAICRQTAQSGELASALRHLGYVMAAKGRASQPAARHYFRQALAVVMRTGAAPVALDVLAGWAGVLMADKATDAERIEAVELASLVQEHATSEYETQEKAKRLLIAWLPALPAEAATSVQARGRVRDLWQTVASITEGSPNQERYNP